MFSFDQVRTSLSHLGSLQKFGIFYITNFLFSDRIKFPRKGFTVYIYTGSERREKYVNILKSPKSCLWGTLWKWSSLAIPGILEKCISVFHDSNQPARPSSYAKLYRGVRYVVWVTDQCFEALRKSRDIYLINPCNVHFFTVLAGILNEDNLWTK